MGHPDQWYGGNTYSQHGEDLVFVNAFHRLKVNPTYMDIGAYHPTEISNTALLYERGARGVNVEANPDLMQAFYDARPEDINLNVGVGSVLGMRKFFRDGKTSGRNSFRLDAVAPLGIEDMLDVEVVSLDALISKYGCPNLLSIDTEGLDYDILLSSELWRDAMIVCVEAAFGDQQPWEPLKVLLEQRGFFLFYWAGSNLIFARSDLRDRMYSPREN